MNVSIHKYLNLIKALPVIEQSFAVKASNWKNLLKPVHFENIFGNEEIIYISRFDIQETNCIELFILKTILWGYPKGMRGKNFENIYIRINTLVEILNVPKGAFLKIDDLYILQKKFKQINGIGLSTYSKLLYFRDFKFDGFPALILDERLVRIFKNGIFQEFKILSEISQYNSKKMYKNYLQIMFKLSEQLNVSGEQIEQFLFIFGNHLKPPKLL
jgi:hypothetical protein